MPDDGRVRVELQNLSCASCAGRAEAALRAVPGVTGAEVNATNAKALLQVDTGFAPKVLADAMEHAGFPVVMHRHVLAVDGLTCAGCVSRVEEAAASAPDVVDATANLANRRVEVGSFDQSSEQVIRSIATAGYRAADVGQLEQANNTREPVHDDLSLRRAGIAAALAAPVVVLEMGGHLYPPFHHMIHATIGISASWTLQFLLTTLVMVWPGRSFFALGLPNLFRGRPDMNALVAMGALAAWTYSVVALVAPGLFPPEAHFVYFEAAAVIITLILAGRALEARARGRTEHAVRALLQLQPDTALVRRDGTFTTVSVGEIMRDETIQIRPGERVPLDGDVIEGQSYVDESMLTGEPMAVRKRPGDALTGGSLNGGGTLMLRATAVGADTRLARIIALVERAQNARLPIQDLLNRVTAWFVPAVMVIAVVTVLAWLLFGPDPALSHALVTGVSVLIIACPCAMGLATPTSVMVGTGRAAQMNVLFRKSDSLQTLSKVKTIAFDKTGTLTQGRPILTDIEIIGGKDEGGVLALAAAVEQASEHPLARAIVQGAAARGLTLAEPADVQTTAGYGVAGLVDGRRVALGTASMMQRERVDPAPYAVHATKMADQGKTPVFVAVDGNVAAILGISDPVKPEAGAVVSSLREMGMDVVMVSGDTSETARVVAKSLGIETVHAGLPPEEKAAVVAELRAGGRTVAFVGDGINDAPALASADVGLAIGTGTDVAIEAADMVLMSGDLSAVLNGVAVSRATMRNIRQNLFWAFAYNIVLIPVAAGLLYPFGGPLLSPMLAAAAMALSSLFVVSNALRLRWVRAAAPLGAQTGAVASEPKLVPA
ncbi:MAG: heavy metal translocating P-type ATPase [Pseudomonadota bacterium]